MKIIYQTLGCKLNFAETSAIGKELGKLGHEKAKSGEDADICVLNTCSVTDVADQKGRQAIRRLHREHPHAKIIVTGCYAQLKPEEVSQIEGVDYVIGANDKHRIPEIVEELTLAAEHAQAECGKIAVTDLQHAAGRLSKEGLAFHPSYSKDDRTRCFLKMQDGCDYYCTYCTIPMARGKSRNGTIADTVKMAQEAIREGAKEIVLTGVNIGDFGKSTGETFIDLLKALDEAPFVDPTCTIRSGEEVVRYRISSCEPNLLTDEIIEFVAHSKCFAPHFHIPLQSGSNEVLRIMHRRYDRELFEERVMHIKQVMPNAFIGVDCMVGVRGETQEMFDDYVTFIKRLPITQLHVFPYSERANTKMVEMDLERVNKQEQKRRVEVLMSISDQKMHDFYAEHKGEEAIVLWEEKKERNEKGEMLMSGWTENYIRVSAPYQKDKINTFEKTII